MEKMIQPVATSYPGKVLAVDRFSVEVSGLANANPGAEVIFDTGARGMIRDVTEVRAKVDILIGDEITIGTKAKISHHSMVIRPSQALLGRVVDPLLNPLDGGKPIAKGEELDLFAEAPKFADRMMINQQLETGVTVIDTLFPIVKGQRIAIMGDPKSGKSSFAQQVAINQARLGSVVVLVLIAKRPTDIQQTISKLKKQKVIDKMVIVVADSLASIPLIALAPYSGCTIGEALWNANYDVVVIYDDLTNHAKVYREMALLSNESPGRESYPGDMFYAHSSLLERAGRRQSNQRSLTSLPIITTSNNDITGHLATSLISITDGQLIFDTEEMQKGALPPVNTGLSVSRVGGRAQARLQKELASEIFKAFVDYRQASEFAHFGQELPAQYKSSLNLGNTIKEFFNQEADEFFSLPEQQVMLKAAFLAGEAGLDVISFKAAVKNAVNSSLASITHEQIAEDLVKKFLNKEVA